MKWFIAVLLLAVFVLSGCDAREENAEVPPDESVLPESPASEGAAYRRITAEAAKEMIDDGGVVILDVRTKEEYAELHIPNALLLPNYDTAPEVLTDKGATILVYCRSGVRSQVATYALMEMGYTAVYDFGGIIDWPFETESGT